MPSNVSCYCIHTSRQGRVRLYNVINPMWVWHHCSCLNFSIKLQLYFLFSLVPTQSLELEINLSFWWPLVALIFLYLLLLWLAMWFICEWCHQYAWQTRDFLQMSSSLWHWDYWVVQEIKSPGYDGKLWYFKMVDSLWQVLGKLKFCTVLKQNLYTVPVWISSNIWWFDIVSMLANSLNV